MYSTVSNTVQLDTNYRLSAEHSS